MWNSKEFLASQLLKSSALPSFALGLGVVGAAFLLRKPAQFLLVKAAQGVIGVGQQMQELYHHTREEIEDIIAEAHYEHLKSKMQLGNEELGQG